MRQRLRLQLRYLDNKRAFNYSLFTLASLSDKIQLWKTLIGLAIGRSNSRITSYYKLKQGDFMRQPFARMAGVFLILSLQLLYNCGPNVENLSIDAEFEKASLVGSTILVGGLTSMVARDKSADIDTESGAQIFRDKLGEKMAGVNVIPASFARETFGEEDYWRILEDYNLNLRMSDLDLQKLGAKFPNGRTYLALARLESYNQWNYKGETKDSTGLVINIFLQTNRKLVAKFTMWDLAAMKQVWSGQISGTATATNNYPQVKGVDWSELGPVGDIIEMAEEEDRREEQKSYVYPESPSFIWTAGNLFNEFANALNNK
jgi:hypothetical protein